MAQEPANGLRYPPVGGTRQRRFDGTSFEPRKLPENAASPTSRVHALLGGVLLDTLMVAKTLRQSLPKLFLRHSNQIASSEKGIISYLFKCKQR